MTTAQRARKEELIIQDLSVEVLDHVHPDGHTVEGVIFDEGTPQWVVVLDHGSASVQHDAYELYTTHRPA